MSCSLYVLGPLVRHTKRGKLLVAGSVGLMVAGGSYANRSGTFEKSCPSPSVR